MLKIFKRKTTPKTFTVFQNAIMFEEIKYVDGKQVNSIQLDAIFRTIYAHTPEEAIELFKEDTSTIQCKERLEPIRAYEVKTWKEYVKSKK